MSPQFKILIVSHNPLSQNNNMGKTLSSYLSQFDKGNVAQLFLHTGLPNCPNCSNYYEFNDEDALHSIFNKRVYGRSFIKEYEDNKNIRRKTNSIYELGRKRHPLISIFRDWVWGLSSLFNKKLVEWIEGFNPDIVFYAAGDYRFSFKIARKISKRFNKPLVSCFFDDFYFSCLYRNELFGKYYFQKMKREIRSTILASSLCFATNPEMSKAYKNEFGIDFPVLFTASPKNSIVTRFIDKRGIKYLGGLGLNRNYQIRMLGEALNHSDHSLFIDVFSNETNSKNIDVIKGCDGVRFMGKADICEINSLISGSKAVIHVESFDAGLKERTKYSLSTKIAESLGSGTLLVAYGPIDIASMRYLKDNNAAIVGEDLTELVNEILLTINDEKRYAVIVNNALALYEKNHTLESVSKVFISEIQKILWRR